MKRALLAILTALLLFPLSAFPLSTEDEAALRQLTKEYASWSYSGRPVEFRTRLDYDSFEEQRRLLIKLAELGWGGLWGDYWRRRDVGDLKILRGFSEKDFWLHFHSTMRPSRSDGASTRFGRTSVEIHAITEARGLAYVIYQAAHMNRSSDTDDDLLVLRARRADGEWRAVANPSITAKLRRELDAATEKKRARK